MVGKDFNEILWEYLEGKGAIVYVSCDTNTF